MIYGNCVGGTGLERTYILVDDKGNEVPAVIVDNETSLDATANDIRIGKVAATNSGVTVGEKVIPTCITLEGFRQVLVGKAFEIPYLSTNDMYDYTKLQVIICPYNESSNKSVAAEKVVINDNVYAVNSTESLAAVTKDVENVKIVIGITNDGDVKRIMRYFMYKEVE